MARMMDAVMTQVEHQTSSGTQHAARHSLDSQIGHYHHLLRSGGTSAATAGATAASCCPLDGVFVAAAPRPPRARRCSADGLSGAPLKPVASSGVGAAGVSAPFPSIAATSSSSFSFPSIANKQRGARRRRYSITMGEIPLRTIKEQDDVASSAAISSPSAAATKAPADSAGAAATPPRERPQQARRSSYSYTNSYSAGSRGRSVLGYPPHAAHGSMNAGYQPMAAGSSSSGSRRRASAGFMNAAAAQRARSSSCMLGGDQQPQQQRRLSMVQHTAHLTSQQSMWGDGPGGYRNQQNHQQQPQAQVLQVHHHNTEDAPAPHFLTQEQIWQCLQRQGGEERQLSTDEQQSASSDLQLWDADADYLVQQLAELSYSTRSASCSSRTHSTSTSRRHSQVQEHRHAMSALSMIEHELQQLLSMQRWLDGAAAVAAPGSKAAAACESARSQHELVLQQAVAAHETIHAAVCDAAAALDEWDDPTTAVGVGAAAGSWAGSYQLHQQPQFGGLQGGFDDAGAPYGRGAHGVGVMTSNYELHSCLEEEQLPDVTPESLLQHFDHYAII